MSSPRPHSLPMRSCGIRVLWRMGAGRRPAAWLAADIYLMPLKPGTYRLICAEHDWDGMIGEIIVE